MDCYSYINDLFVPPDPALHGALESAAAAGIPPIEISPSQGQLLSILAQSIGARAILEIGTLGGYSTIWLASALAPGGKLITLEIDLCQILARALGMARVGLAEIVDVRLGNALDILPQLVAEGQGPFDLVFIDADKQNNAAYFEWALKLTRRGSLIIADNVVRYGAVIDADSNDDSVHGVRRFNAAVAAEPRGCAAPAKRGNLV